MGGRLVVIVAAVAASVGAALRTLARRLTQEAFEVNAEGDRAGNTSPATASDRVDSDLNGGHLWIRSLDGLRLHGRFQPAGTGTGERGSVLLVHGHGASGVDVEPVAEAYRDSGYAVLTIDSRGRGSSEGSFGSLGWSEGRDVTAWLAQLRSQSAVGEIILHGISMGANAVLNAAAAADDGQLRFVVADSPFTSVSGILTARLHARRLPATPVLLATSLLLRRSRTIKIFRASTLRRVRAISCPIVYLHCVGDTQNPAWMTQKLFQRSSRASLVLVDGQAHTASNAMSADAYVRLVLATIDK